MDVTVRRYRLVYSFKQRAAVWLFPVKPSNLGGDGTIRLRIHRV